MRKAIIGFVVLVFLVSCASISEYQKTYKAELAERDARLFGSNQSTSMSSIYNDSSLDLLLGLYAFSIIRNPSTYPLYSYNPYLFSPLDSFSGLMVYESMLQSINRMETLKFSFEIQRILDELKREAAKIKD